jgi:NAD(P)-dependent dehydrogenase (short-subunit alcohol dehydrogenase family)
MSEPSRANSRGSAFSVAGRAALVTGGVTGIGLAVAKAFAESGARVAVTYRPNSSSQEAVPEALGALKAAGGIEAFPVPVDIRSVEQVRHAIAEAAAALGRLDILVNSAGTNIQQLALDVDEETWDAILDTNLKGLFFACQATVKQMLGQDRLDDEPYAIVNVASQMGLVGYHHRAAYCASKAGVVNLTRVLAVEWAEHAIRVNAVAPGFIDTPLARPILADPEFKAEVIRCTPNAQIGRAQDVASGVLYLCGAGARHVTGHTLSIDGGWTAW